jgi:hypothetical protein
MNNTIKQYVNDRKGNRRGVIVAFKPGDNSPTAYFGWSYVNTNAGDKFDKHIGTTIALNRTSRQGNKTLPHDIKKMLPQFLNRARNYFKVMEVI